MLASARVQVYLYLKLISLLVLLHSFYNNKKIGQGTIPDKSIHNELCRQKILAVQR